MSPDNPVACNIGAISAADRPAHRALLDRLRLAIRDRAENADGYTFTLDDQAMSLADVAQWITLERFCCPFLKFDLSVSGTEANWSLTLSGPKGTKAILDAEF